MWKLYFRKPKLFIETLPNGVKHLASYNKKGTHYKIQKNIKFLKIIIF